MKNIWLSFFAIILLTSNMLLFTSCSKDDGETTINLGISPSANANAGTSYTLSKTDIRVNVFDATNGNGTLTNVGNLRDAVAYLDANGDGFTDIFMATGEFQLMGEVDCILAINDGNNNFTVSTAEFGGNMPPATHARKSITTDFNGDGLMDIFVFDHGFDGDPFPGSNPKLIIQDATGSFSWTKLTDQTGFHHGGASGDIDNDGDMDVFVGGNEAFFYINDGKANFEMVTDRFDRSIPAIFSAELIDVDEDGFIDLLVGAHEQDGDQTSIYWGSSSGSYSSSLRTIIPPVDRYGVILDFDAEDFDGDGDRDLVVSRTGSDNFYVGRRFQLLIHDGNRTFTDKTNKIDNPGKDSDIWFPWLRAQDIDDDGDIDLFSDDLQFGLEYINDGKGNFIRN